MKIHFFTAPFYFAFIGFRVQGSGFRVQGSGLSWRLRRLFFEDGILVSQSSSLKRRPEGQRISFVDDGFLAFR